MDSLKQGPPFKSPFLRPVVLFRKKREKFLREKSDVTQPQGESGLPNYMRSTQTSRVKTRRRLVLLDIIPEEENEGSDAAAKTTSVPGGTFQKLSRSEYLSEQREKVYTKFAHSVRQSINERLEEDIKMKLKEITLAEKHVEEEEMAFRKRIEERQKKLDETLQQAEQYSKLKTELNEECKKKTAQIQKLKSEIEDFLEKLREYKQYKDCLVGLAPATWQEQQRLKREERKQARLERLKSQEAGLLGKGKKTKKCPQKCHKKSAKKRSQEDQTGQLDDDSYSDEEPEIYFTDPMDMLTALDALKQENLSCIQDFNDTREKLSGIQKDLHQTKTELTTKMRVGSEKIEKLKANIKATVELASNLELKCKLFSYGEYNINQDKEIKSLHEKVKAVYEKCTEEVDPCMLSMLCTIKHKVYDISERIDSLPPGMFEAIERTREAERKAKMLQEKQEMEKQRQMERRRQATERAFADTKRVTTRRLVYRSPPPIIKKKAPKSETVKVTQEQLDYEYYFT